MNWKVTNQTRNYILIGEGNHKSTNERCNISLQVRVFILVRGSTVNNSKNQIAEKSEGNDKIKGNNEDSSNNGMNWKDIRKE